LVRTQLLLIFAFCLVLVGTGMVFVNAYIIDGLKNRLSEQALWLAEEQGRHVAEELFRLHKNQGASLHDLGEDLDREIRIVLRGREGIAAYRVFDLNGDFVPLTHLNPSTNTIEPALIEGGPAFAEIRFELLKKKPRARAIEREFVIGDGDEILGSLRLLITDSAIYRDIELTSSDITRHLWGVLLAFVGVLALGFSLTARLLRRRVQLLGDNERLGRMAYVGTLASGLAHEIRNPLNAMAMNLTVVEEEIDAADSHSPEMIKKALGHMTHEVTRLNHSVTNFLKFARPDDSRPQQATELRPLVDEILTLLKPQIEDTGTQIEIDLPDEARVEADFSGLHQVVYNIVLNSLQAMASSPDSAGPRVLRIGGRRESAQWFLWIEDTGPGLAAGEEGQVFEAFHTTKAAGSGLGLAIARAIIDSHNGDITARRADGGGARFEITLPETSLRR
jgi:signal transduction histidine kinase